MMPEIIEDYKYFRKLQLLYLKCVHIYLTVTAWAAVYFCLTRIRTQPVEFIVSVIAAVYLSLLFFRRDRTTLFYNMAIILALQVVTFKTAAFGYIFGLGVGICAYLAVGEVNTPEFLAILSLIDFSAVGPDKDYMIGFNLHALILFAFTFLAKEKKNDYMLDFS